MISPRRPVTWIATRSAACLLFAGALLLAATTLADAKPRFTQADLSRFVSRAEALYAEAAQVVGRYPASRDFFQSERRFQDDLNKYDAGDYGSATWDGRVRIEQFDNFLYNSMIYYRCPATARADLRIARQILDHARLDMKGRVQTDWMPDLDSVPDCSR
jgi:hypothetical protein